MKPSKPTLLTLSLLIVILLTVPIQTCLFSSAAANLENTSITFVNLLKDRQFYNATDFFSPEMTRALPSQELESTWDNLIGATGKFEGINKTRIAEESSYQVVYVTCKFAKDTLDVRIVFDDQSQIVGLWFVATATEGIHGIYIAALLVTVVCVALWGALLRWFSGGKWKYFALILVTLPFSLIVNLLVKGPPPQLGVIIRWHSAKRSYAFVAVSACSFPLTHNRRSNKTLAPTGKTASPRNQPLSALWIGVALGVGFGIGEIWYLAWQFSMVLGYSGHPFYYFGGFIWERLIVVFLHGVMTAVAVVGFLNGKRGFLLGYMGTVLLHALTNFGAVLYQVGVWDPPYFHATTQRTIKRNKPQEPPTAA